MKKIIFINHFNNGDIHLSRSFVKLFKNYFPDYLFSYSHRRDIDLLKDIEIDIDRTSLFKLDINQPWLIDGDNIYVNTWYGTNDYFHMNHYGLSFDCLYSLFNDFADKVLNVKLQDISDNIIDFFPDIDFSKFTTNNIDSWCSQHNNPKIFISNGRVLSDQSNNFSFAPMVNYLSDKYKNHIFILSNFDKTIKNKNNVYFSQNIIKKNGFDLNENAYLSNKCNLVIGKCSGAFTFSINKTSLFSTGQTFLSFSNLGYTDKFWLNTMFRDKISYKSKIINSSEIDYNNIIKIIMDNLP